MEPIKNNDNEKIEEIKDIEKNGMRELSDEELEGVAGGFGFNAFRTPDFEPDWSH